MSYFTKFRLGRVLGVGVVAVLASVALVSVVQAARSTSAQRPSAAAGQYPEKVTICHRTGSQKNPVVTIRVSRNALPAHLRHGDTIGPCAGQSFTVCHKNHKSKAPEGQGQGPRTMKCDSERFVHTRDTATGCAAAARPSPVRQGGPRPAAEAAEEAEEALALKETIDREPRLLRGSLFIEPERRATVHAWRCRRSG